LASRRITRRTRAQAERKRREITKPRAGIEHFLQASAALQDARSFEQQIVQVLDAAREVLAVDRVHIWAVAPQGDRLIHVASAGLSESDRQSLGRGMEIPVAEAGAMARAYRGKLSFVVDEAHPLPPKSRLKPPYSAVKALRTNRFVIVPIVARGGCLGVLVADNKYARGRHAAIRSCERSRTVSHRSLCSGGLGQRGHAVGRRRHPGRRRQRRQSRNAGAPAPARRPSSSAGRKRTKHCATSRF
jgi:hypothetical protein